MLNTEPNLHTFAVRAGFLFNGHGDEEHRMRPAKSS